MGVFETLAGINVNEHTEKKEGLTYLTWSWAWDEIKRMFPEASYTIWKNEQGLPYVYDPLTGFMVYTSVTIDGITHEMWLPVMDGKNKAMKAESYTYKTKYGEKTVEPATMFDINKTIMRCLVKNLAMFGLGLYIYAGEDLPATEEEVKPVGDKAVANADLRVKAFKELNKHNKEYVKAVCEHYNLKDIKDITDEQAKDFLKALEDKKNE